jgi:hypothetical protein
MFQICFMGIFRSVGLACFGFTLIPGICAGNNRAPNLPDASGKTTIVLASFPQDKPPCTMKTIYLPEPDGGMLEVKLAYPITQQATNARGIPYFSVPALPQGASSESETNEFWGPAGASLVLQEENLALPRPRPKGQLLSVKRHERPLGHSPRNTKFENSSWQIFITDPPPPILAGSITQIKGFSTAPLDRLTCTIRNGLGRIDDEPGFIADKYFDSRQWDFTTNWFHWLDAPLALGTNFLELKFTAQSGATFTTNLVLAFLPHLDLTLPHLTIQWPPPDAHVATDFLTIRGTIDNANTEIFARITAAGRSETKAALVERTRRFWVDRLPLLDKTNWVTLVAVDSAGNRTTTNFSVFRNSIKVTVDPVPEAELWHLQTTVTGTITPSDFNVRVNDVVAKVQPDGRWFANGIPLDLDGVAIFDIAVIPKASESIATSKNSAIEPPAGKIHGALALETIITIPGVVLNATMPSYGNFRLRASGVAGRSFVLLSSPNLVDWAPVLTNLNSAAVFEYADTNAVAHGCRFFKIVPFREPTTTEN